MLIALDRVGMVEALQLPFGLAPQSMLLQNKVTETVSNSNYS